MPQERPAAAARPPRHPVSAVDGTLSPADSFSAQCARSRRSMSLHYTRILLSILVWGKNDVAQECTGVAMLCCLRFAVASCSAASLERFTLLLGGFTPAQLGTRVVTVWARRRLRESMILPDDIPRSLSSRPGDAVDARPHSSPAHRRRSESDTNMDRRGAARSERSDAAVELSALAPPPFYTPVFARSAADAAAEAVANVGRREVRLSPKSACLVFLQFDIRLSLPPAGAPPACLDVP